MSQGNTTLLDTITRIYKNADDSVIGIHSIFITENRPAVPDGNYIEGYTDRQDRNRRTATIKSSFDTFNLVLWVDMVKTIFVNHQASRNVLFQVA